MRLGTILIGVTAAIVIMGSSAVATPTLTLSSPDNLGTLTVGQEFQIDVTLSERQGLEFLFSLSSKADFSAALLEPVSGPTAVFGVGSVFQQGATVPQVDRFNELSSLSADSVIGRFQDFPDSAAINSNGLFYSFRMKAKAVGVGTFDFDPAATTYFSNLGSGPVQIAGALTYSIRPVAPAVPEPATLLGGGLGAVAVLAGMAWRSRKSARVASCLDMG